MQRMNFLEFRRDLSRLIVEALYDSLNNSVEKKIKKKIILKFSIDSEYQSFLVENHIQYSCLN